MNKVELKHLLPNEIGVNEGIASLVANISGTFDKIILILNYLELYTLYTPTNHIKGVMTKLER